VPESEACTAWQRRQSSGGVQRAGHKGVGAFVGSHSREAGRQGDSGTGGQGVMLFDAHCCWVGRSSACTTNCAAREATGVAIGGVRHQLSLPLVRGAVWYGTVRYGAGMKTGKNSRAPGGWAGPIYIRQQGTHTKREAMPCRIQETIGSPEGAAT